MLWVRILVAAIILLFGSLILGATGDAVFTPIEVQANVGLSIIAAAIFLIAQTIYEAMLGLKPNREIMDELQSARQEREDILLEIQRLRTLIEGKEKI